MSDAARLYVAQFKPDAEALRRMCGELGSGLSTQLAELERSPHPDRCDTILANLEGAAIHVRTMRAAMLLEGSGCGSK